MEYTNDINYLCALEYMTRGMPSLYTFHESRISKSGDVFQITLDTKNLYAGDILEYIHVKGKNIKNLRIVVDNNLIWEQNFPDLHEVTVKPFIDGIHVVSCDRSTIKLVVNSESISNVKSLYTLVSLKDRLKRWRIKTSHNSGLSYFNGYLCKIYTGANYENYCR